MSTTPVFSSQKLAAATIVFLAGAEDPSVSAEPCAHTINQMVLSELLSKMAANMSGFCPACETAITGFTIQYRFDEERELKNIAKKMATTDIVPGLSSIISFGSFVEKPERNRLLSQFAESAQETPELKIITNIGKGDLYLARIN